MAGLLLTVVERRDFDWAFGFAGGVAISASCPWRILIDGRIALTVSDDRQKFGLPAPVDAQDQTLRLLSQKPIERVAVRPDTGDLSIIFPEDAALELLNMSSGYEGWQINMPGLNVIATGGGELAVIATPTPSPGL